MARDEVGDAVESGGEMDSYEFYDQVEEEEANAKQGHDQSDGVDDGETFQKTTTKETALTFENVGKIGNMTLKDTQHNKR